MKEFFRTTDVPRYVGPPHHYLDIASHFVEFLSLLPVGKINTNGTEINIPVRRKHFMFFIPHSNVETQPIDRIYRQLGLPLPVWFTKKENEKDQPIILGGPRRFIFADRVQITPSTIRAVDRVYKHPHAVIGTSIEGTRFGNPNDGNDIRTLKEAEPGTVYFATRERVPILPVVVYGGDKFLTALESIKKKYGYKAMLEQFYREVRAKSKPVIEVRFAKPYTDHILPEGVKLDKEKSKQHNNTHTNNLMLNIAIPLLLELDIGYPLGPYEKYFRN
ncbi:hypothetical protein HYT02_05120 [Candidatus Gottesmanbacteria bacterium]|nr:hypothetical protein [Candidatus Gottesmanbacteria bacterium]